METIKKLLIGLIAVIAGILAYELAFRAAAFVYEFIVHIPLIGRIIGFLFRILPGDLPILGLMGCCGAFAAYYASTAVISLGRQEIRWPVRMTAVVLCLLFVLSLLMSTEASPWGIVRTIVWGIEAWFIVKP